MKPVYQTKFGTEGNCLSAALASILELPLDDVPDFAAIYHAEPGAAWCVAMDNFLARLGLQAVEIQADRLNGFRPRGFHLISGKSPRGLDHCTVGYAGKIVHDPHPDGGGLLEIETFTLFVALLGDNPCPKTS